MPDSDRTEGVCTYCGTTLALDGYCADCGLIDPETLSDADAGVDSRREDAEERAWAREEEERYHRGVR